MIDTNHLKQASSFHVSTVSVHMPTDSPPSLVPCLVSLWTLVRPCVPHGVWNLNINPHEENHKIHLQHFSISIYWLRPGVEPQGEDVDIACNQQKCCMETSDVWPGGRRRLVPPGPSPGNCNCWHSVRSSTAEKEQISVSVSEPSQTLYTPRKYIYSQK